MTFSVGGGMFSITELDGFAVDLDGTRPVAFVCCPADRPMPALEAYARQEHHDRILYTIPLGREEDGAWLRQLPGALWVRIADRIMPVPRPADSQVPFRTAAEALACGHRAAWQLALDYECAAGGISEAAVLSLTEHTARTMEQSTVPPDPATTAALGFLPLRAQIMANTTANLADTGHLQAVLLAAVAVMENSCAHCIVAAAPTAGSAGVVPAAVITLGRQMNLPDADIHHGLLAAGLVGSFIANSATFAAETAGCQAEMGSAAAMAAAGVAQLLGGTTEQCFRAAAIALQNMLGLICDPVAGLTEVPCISRNVSAAANAVLSANLALLGFDPLIPLDETIETMLRVGRQLPGELRCTCAGGLCTTPTGCALAKQMEAGRGTL